MYHYEDGGTKSVILLGCLKFGPIYRKNIICSYFWGMIKATQFFFVSAGQQFLMVFNPLTRIKIKKYQQKNNIRVKIIWNGLILEQKVPRVLAKK